jgi:hypothetical protein
MTLRVLTGTVRWLGALAAAGLTGWGALALAVALRRSGWRSWRSSPGGAALGRHFTVAT